MRTKVLLCAAIMAASLASSMAQNVYSLNVVGYVNVTLPPGKFSVVANPLDATMGGTVAGANEMAALFGSTNGNIALSSKFQQFLGTDWGPTINYGATKKWVSSFDMKPGVGALFYNNGLVDTVVTFVGQVPQGNYTVNTLAANAFTLVGASVPIGGDLTNSTTVIGLTPNIGDTVSTFLSTANDWSAVSKWAATKKWVPTTTINPGQGFLYYNNGAVKTWTSNFTVQ